LSREWIVNGLKFATSRATDEEIGEIRIASKNRTMHISAEDISRHCAVVFSITIAMADRDFAEGKNILT